MKSFIICAVLINTGATGFKGIQMDWDCGMHGKMRIGKE
jgi:hypothetical protein